QNPKAVVTEYAWDASTCDPCPGPNLNGNDFLTLGADVLPGKPQYGFVLTRLHARYNSTNLGEDLIFKAAPPILGGREILISKHQAEQESQPGNVNNFQGRYIIRHPWEGAIACQNPIRGRWGGPPAGKTNPGPVAAEDLGMVKRGGVELASLTMQNIPAVKLKAKTDLADSMNTQAPKDTQPSEGAGKAQAPESDAKGSQEGCTTTPGAPAPSFWGLWALALVGLIQTRRHRRRC
ncbi:MAG: MYXO-CTERM sorting domain-containing protein, partial [Myxococcota bacterium]